MGDSPTPSLQTDVDRDAEATRRCVPVPQVVMRKRPFASVGTSPEIDVTAFVIGASVRDERGEGTGYAGCHRT